MQVVWWAVTAALVVGAGIYGYMEYQAYLLRTKVTTLTGGLRFTAQGLMVESRHSAKEVVVQTRQGDYTHQKAAGSDPETQTGNLTATFAAIGLKIKTSRIVVTPEGGGEPLETGFSSIHFLASDDLVCRAEARSPGENSSLHIDHVPNPIAQDFQNFANRLNHWIDKIEHSIKLDIEKRRKEEEERARLELLAAAKAKKSPAVSLTDTEREAKAATQIDAWRATAGFKGSSTEVSINADGVVAWFIDLHPAGKAILHAGKRTFHGSLQGAKVTVLTGELEIGVRDDYWTEDEPQLLTFRILAGTPPESRLAWKERLEILIRDLG